MYGTEIYMHRDFWLRAIKLDNKLTSEVALMMQKVQNKLDLISFGNTVAMHTADQKKYTNNDEDLALS